MWSKLYKLAKQYDCWHKWVEIRKDDKITYYRCSKCGKTKECYLE